MKKVVGYIRVSTMEQVKEGYSIEGQKYQILTYCNQHNLQLIKCYIDEGISGKNLEERIGMKKMLEDASIGMFEEIITWKVSRVARNVKDLLGILEIVNRHNITFKTISEGITTESLNGIFCLQMLGAVAELERNIIIDNVKLCLEKRWQDGWYSGAGVYGYDLIPKKMCQEQGRASNLKVNEGEAKIVVEIYKRYEEGQGYKAIVNYLNGQGILSKKGKQFSVEVVKKILENSIYLGFLKYTVGGKERLIKSEHIPIISLEQWNKVQELKGKKINNETKSNHEFTLQKLLKCPACRSTMVAKTIRRGVKIYYYYSCSAYENRGNQACKPNLLVAGKIEEEIYDYLKDYLNQVWIIDGVQQKLFNSTEDFREIMKEANRLKVMQDILGKRKRLLMKRFETDQITQENFVAKMQVVKEEAIKIEGELDRWDRELEKHKVPTIKKEAIKKAFQQMEEVLQNGDQRLTKEVLQVSIKEILIGEDKHIEQVIFNKGYEELFAMKQEG